MQFIIPADNFCPMLSAKHEPMQKIVSVGFIDIIWLAVVISVRNEVESGRM